MRLIDANALIENAQVYEVECGDEIGDDAREIKAVAVSRIENAPTIDPAKHGHWIDTERYSKKLWMTIHKTVCSVCKESHEELPLGEWKFCPNCGARMDGEA